MKGSIKKKTVCGSSSSSSSSRATAVAKSEELNLKSLSLSDGCQAPSSSSSNGVERKKRIVWQCNDCNHRCIPVRAESRCLCGHRYKVHKGGKSGFKCCDNARCKCPEFFFLIAEGAWILRCQCKHKGIEHDPISRACTKTNCKCTKFSSPWVCNCNHAWASHEQSTVFVDEDDARDVGSLSDLTMFYRTDLRTFTTSSTSSASASSSASSSST